MITLYDTNGVPAYPLDVPAASFYVTHVYGGLDTLAFDISPKHPLYPHMAEEIQVEYAGILYKIKSINERATTSTITCHLDLDFLREEIHLTYTSTTRSLRQVLAEILPGWTLENVDLVTIRRSMELTNCTDYDVVMQAMETYGVVYEWHNKEHRVTVIKPELIQPSGEYLTDELNLKQLTFKGSSSDLITRLYPMGKDGLTIAEVNGGKTYVEDLSYCAQVLSAVWVDERYTDAQSLKDDALERLKTSAYPVRSYECTVLDLAKANPTYSKLGFGLYQIVTLIDRQRGTRIDHRVMEYKEYPLQPDQNVITLANVATKITAEIKRVESKFDGEIEVDRTILKELREDADAMSIRISDTYTKGETDAAIASQITQSTEGIRLEVSETYATKEELEDVEATAGRGIVSITEYYAVSASSTTAPTEWQTAVPTMTETNRYLWNYEETSYSDQTKTSTAKRVIGVYGEQGIGGSDGRGITSITNYYLASDSSSGVTVDTSGWTTAVQSTSTAKRYLWNYEKVVYTDETSTTIGPRIIGTHGADGVSVSSVVVEYYLSSSATTQTGGSWSATVPAWVNGKYMWSRTKTTLSNGTASTTQPVCITGATGAAGAAGKGVKSIVTQFYLSSSKTSQTGGSWVTTMPTWSPGKYVWTRSLITYTDNTTTTTTPQCDSSWEAVNEVQVGGRNLLLRTKSNLKADMAFSANDVIESEEDGYGVLRLPGKGSNYMGIYYATEIPAEVASDGSVTTGLEAGDYTFSIDAKSTIVYSAGLQLRLFKKNSDGSYTNAATVVTPVGYTFEKTSSWNRYSCTFNAKNLSWSPGATAYSDCVVCFGFVPQASLASGQYFEVKRAKLETGNKATDWSPAPEDVDKNITDAVDGVQVGGRNLLLDSAVKKIKPYSGATLNFETVEIPEWNAMDAIRVYGTGGTSQIFGLMNGTSGSTLLSVSGQKYVFSIYMKNNHESNLYISGNSVAPIQTVKPGESRRVEALGTGDGTHSLQFSFSTTAAGDEFDFVYWHPKIEIGTKATDWTPAPEDIEQSIANTATQTKTELNAALDVASGNILSTVSSTYTRKSELEELRQYTDTQINQTVEDITFSFTTVQEAVDLLEGKVDQNKLDIEEYIRFSGALIELGKVGNPFVAKLDNTKLAFLQDGNEIAYISNNKLYITDAELKGKLTMTMIGGGFFDWVPEQNGSLSLVWRDA